jgi:dethiobiotin synthetase
MMEKRRKFDVFAVHSSLEAPGVPVPLSALVGALSNAAGESQDMHPVKWAWICRYISQENWEQQYCLRLDAGQPKPGDIAMVEVEKLGHHHYLETDKARRLRLYKGDKLICAFGNRYATEAYEGRALDPNKNKLHLLSGSGMIGTVISRHRDIVRPTGLSFLGYLTDNAGTRINMRDLPHFQPADKTTPKNVIVVAGTGMSTGKTTVMRRVLHGLAARGVRVAGCKLTGTASPRDLLEMRATGALFTTDFSDYGFPSTYGVDMHELIGLFDRMTDACSRKGADIIVMEVADGLLQRETRMILKNDLLRHRICGVLVASTCSGSALYATESLQKSGLDVWAVSGLITNSPLFVREFKSNSSVPVASSRTGDQLTDIVMNKLELRRIEKRPLEMSAKVQ